MTAFLDPDPGFGSGSTKNGRKKGKTNNFNSSKNLWRAGGFFWSWNVFVEVQEESQNYILIKMKIFGQKILGIDPDSFDMDLKRPLTNPN